MSSARNNTLGSTVFQQTLVSSAAFVLVSLALLWVICGGMIWQIDRNQIADIEETMTYAEDVYYGRGLDALIDEEIRDDTDVIWSDDFIFELLEQEQLLWTLRNADYDPVAGFPGLHAEFGFSIVGLDHPEIRQSVRALSRQLRGGDRLTIAAFLPEARANIVAFAQWGSLALLLIVLPLALITGYVLSQRVFQRIEGISATASAVASGEMTTRVAQSPRHDEFDRLGGSINQMLDQVEDLNRSIEDVSVGVAHDLRTPLTNIGGRLELIRRDRSDPQAVETHVDAAEAAQDQLMRVFDALLRLGEVKAGQRKSAFAPVDLSALVADLADTFAPVFADADKHLTVQVQSGLQIEGDQELLQQLIANLLENAVEHSRDAAQAFVTLERADGRIVLKIGDDGPGISPLHRDRIFERFFRADASRGTAGNGLGLSLVQAIAALHQAELALAPDIKGAVFSVLFLPRT